MTEQSSDPKPAAKPKKPKTPGSGRKKGSRNKSTLLRELEAKKAAEIIEMAREAEFKKVAFEDAIVHRRKLAKEILDDFMTLFSGMAAYYQPAPPMATEPNKNANLELFKEYALLAVQAAKELAPYQTPRLGALMIGQAQTRKIEVVGGLPDSSTPAPELPPDTEADSFKVIESKPAATSEKVSVEPAVAVK